MGSRTHSRLLLCSSSISLRRSFAHISRLGHRIRCLWIHRSIRIFPRTWISRSTPRQVSVISNPINPPHPHILTSPRSQSMLRTRHSRPYRLSHHLHPSFGEIPFREIIGKIGAFDEELQSALSRLVLVCGRLFHRCFRPRCVSPFPPPHFGLPFFLLNLTLPRFDLPSSPLVLPAQQITDEVMRTVESQYSTRSSD